MSLALPLPSLNVSRNAEGQSFSATAGAGGGRQRTMQHCASVLLILINMTGEGIDLAVGSG